MTRLKGELGGRIVTIIQEEVRPKSRDPAGASKEE